jgi:hypothetical protein
MSFFQRYAVKFECYHHCVVVSIKQLNSLFFRCLYLIFWYDYIPFGYKGAIIITIIFMHTSVNTLRASFFFILLFFLMLQRIFILLSSSLSLIFDLEN